MRANRVAAVGLLIVAVSCTQARTTGSPRGDTEGGTAAHSTVSEAPCPAGGDCGAAVIMNGREYSLSCAAIREDLVRGVLGRGSFWQKDVEIRAVDGVEPQVLVAISLPGGACAEGDSVRSPWSLAFDAKGDAGEDGRLEEAICRAGDLSPAQRRANGCKD